MEQKSNLALIGPRGVGKSTVAKLISEKLNRPLFIIDELVQYEAEGNSIEQIVDSGGWSSFRDLELFVLNKLTKCSNSIIDCGGGILVEAPSGASMYESFSERKFEQLSHCAKLVYLQRPLEQLVGLVPLDSNRPKLADDYKQLLARRLPWYEKAADVVAEIGNQTAEEVATEVINKAYS